MTPIVKSSVGENALASTLNRIKQNIEERTPLEGENYRVVRTGKGWRLVIDVPQQQPVSTNRPVWL